MRVLVVGSGAREHALVWKLAQSPLVERIYTAPGNAGTASISTNLPIAASDIAGLADAAREHQIDLTVVGPEDPLAAGLADAFIERGLAVFGPVADAARIESSKSWAKDVMIAAQVPTARSERFHDLEAALDAVADADLPLVIKADGLAAGKGVIVAETRTEAEQAVRSMLSDGAFGAAGSEILIEEYLTGREVSVLALTDGRTIYPLIPACDYKRVKDNDLGLNTGGMGAYAPVPAVDRAMMSRIRDEILAPTIAELNRRGITYRGVLYAGLILTRTGPQVIEFNCRFGDPETEVVLPLMRDDLVPLLMATANGTLAEIREPSWHDGACVAVVLASGGYPLDYKKGYQIGGLDELPDDIVTFHAGTSLDDTGHVVTSGGRVLALAARAATFHAARERVYQAVEQVTFNGRQFRGDIAAREIAAT